MKGYVFESKVALLGDDTICKREISGNYSIAVIELIKQISNYYFFAIIVTNFVVVVSRLEQIKKPKKSNNSNYMTVFGLRP